jgi:hypothetical protein
MYSSAARSCPKRVSGETWRNWLTCSELAPSYSETDSPKRLVEVRGFLVAFSTFNALEPADCEMLPLPNCYQKHSRLVVTFFRKLC